MLARPGLALRGLDLDPGALHPVADLADQRLVVGRGEDVVVEDVRHRRRQVAVVLRVRLRVRLLEEVELELGADHRREAERLAPARPARSAPGAATARPASRRARRRRTGRAPSPRATGCAAASRGRASARSRRSRAPSSRSRSRGPGPSPCRARAGSCSPRPRGPPSISSRKNSPCRRLPISRPCMSVKATMTVSIAPTPRSPVNSSKLSTSGDPTPRAVRHVDKVAGRSA